MNYSEDAKWYFRVIAGTIVKKYGEHSPGTIVKKYAQCRTRLSYILQYVQVSSGLNPYFFFSYRVHTHTHPHTHTHTHKQTDIQMDMNTL